MWTRRTKFKLPTGAKIFLFDTMPRLTLGSKWPLVQFYWSFCARW